MSSGSLFTCPYHETQEPVPGVPYLLECGCKCMQAFDREADASKAADAEGGAVAEWKPSDGTKYVVVIYVPTAVPTPR
jgi:hypothetical protein